MFPKPFWEHIYVQGSFHFISNGENVWSEIGRLSPDLVPAAERQRSGRREETGERAGVSALNSAAFQKLASPWH